MLRNRSHFRNLDLAGMCKQGGSLAQRFMGIAQQRKVEAGVAGKFNGLI
jgi:hypothetical protein